MRRLPQDASMRPSESATVTRPSRPSTSLAAEVARPPSSANTTSWSMEWALTSTAAGARSKAGSTSYSSRHRYQDMRISGRTPWTVSAPPAKRSQAAEVFRKLSSSGAVPLVAGAPPFVRSLAPFIPSPLAVGEKRFRIVITGRTNDLKLIGAALYSATRLAVRPRRSKALSTTQWLKWGDSCMRAVVYRKPYEVTVEEVPDPRIEQPNDVIVRITSSCICGSDLHMYEGRTAAEPGIVFGHENLGIIEEVGSGVTGLEQGDRVVMPFNVACGFCKNCLAGSTGFCLTVNPSGFAGGAYGYVAMGPYRGGQAEYLRVPYADFNCLKLPSGREHETDFILLADIFPTGYHGCDLALVSPGGDRGGVRRRPRWPDGRLRRPHQ